MRKVLISIAAAVSVLAIATPASAQRYPRGGYNNGYNNGYNAYGESNRLITLNQQRLQRMHWDIRQFVAQGRLHPREAAQFERQVSRLGQELQAVARNGMTGTEGAIFDSRADRLNVEIQRRAGVGYGYGYGGYPGW
jgi:hypothetical protein